MKTGAIDIDRILVTRLRFMGDIVLTTPLLQALRQARPDAHITYLAEWPYITLLEHHPAVDQTMALHRGKKGGGLAVIGQLMRRRFDTAIDLFGNPRSALLTLCSGAPRRIGGDFRGRRHLYTDRIRDNGELKSAVEFHLSYLAPLEVPADPGDPQLFLTEEESRWAEQYLRRLGYDIEDTIVGIHPGATWPAKRWLPQRFAALAGRLTRKGAQILFTMGPGEKPLIDSVMRNCRFSVAEPALLTLRQLAAVLKRIDLYISNDCGPMHVAPAVDTPTLGLFGPSRPEIWFPYRREAGHRPICKEIDCRPCDRDHCETNDCMKAITVDEVEQAALDVLDGAPKLSPQAEQRNG